MDKDIEVKDCPFCGKKADLTHTSSILGGGAVNGRNYTCYA